MAKTEKQEKITGRKRSYIKYYYSEKNHERIKKVSREKYHIDLQYQKATLERAKNRYYEDEEYMRATIRRAIERYKKKKLRKILETQLPGFAFQNGLITLPKKGKITLVAKSKIKSEQLICLLKYFDIKVSKPILQEGKYYHTINEKELEKRLREIFIKKNKFKNYF